MSSVHLPRAGQPFGMKVKRISNILCVITSALLRQGACMHESVRGSIKHWQHNDMWVHELWVSLKEQVLVQRVCVCVCVTIMENEGEKALTA